MKLSDINACVVIPTYNNENTLKRVIDGVLQYGVGKEIIVVNDGATDSTSIILESYGDQIVVLGYENNVGKGNALRLAFKHAVNAGYDNIITIDSDGQHFPQDIPLFIKAAKEQSGVLFMGARDMGQESVPGKSSMGNRISNYWFWVETGLKLPDTQTGFRLYPASAVRNLRLFTKKFELEIEVIVKASWRGVAIESIPVKVKYDPNERVTHFRPFQDFTRIGFMHAYLVTLTLLYYLHIRLFKKIRKKGLWTIIKEEIVKRDETNLMKATSIGFGFFMGIIPLWGFQLLIGVTLSIVFKMNKALFVAAANISIPPLIPLVVYGSYIFGGLILNERIDLTFDFSLNVDSIYFNLRQYLIGACTLAVFVGGVGFVISLLLFNLFRPHSK